MPRPCGFFLRNRGQHHEIHRFTGRPVIGATAPVLAEVREHASTLGHFTRWVNHVGGCAISLPAGFDANGLPVGIQLVGRSGGDATVLGIAQAFQEATDWHRREPDLAAWHASARGDQPVSN